MRSASIGLVATLVACAPDEDEFDLPIEVCGEDEPVQILALEDEQVIGARASARFGDGWLFGVRTFEIPLTSVDTALQGAEGRPYRQTGAEIVSVGECGDDRRVVATGVDTIFPATNEDEPWLGCVSDTGDLYWFDPDGGWEPRFVGRSERCGQHVVVGDRVFVFLAGGALVRADLDDEDFVPEVLVSDVVGAPYLWDQREWGLAPPDDIFVLRSDRTVVRVALRTGVTQVEVEGADSFTVSDDRRWLTWGIQDEDGNAKSAWLRDRGSGEDVLLGAPTWTNVVAYVNRGLVVATGQVSTDGTRATQILDAASLRSVWLDGSWIVWGSDGDVLVVSDSVGVGTEVALLDFESGERTKLTDTHGSIVVEAGAIWDVDFDRYDDVDLPDGLAPFDVIRIPIDTRDREVARARVFSSLELSADRWIVESAPDDHSLVELHFMDGASLRHRAFAEDVVSMDPVFDIWREATQGPPPITDELVYQVHTRASERTGVWRVRFTP